MTQTQDIFHLQKKAFNYRDVMKIITSISEINQLCNSGNVIGLVPTMGAIHDGHISLVKNAKKDCNIVIVSIFTNPIQFATDDDFSSYPRSINKDLDLLRNVVKDKIYIKILSKCDINKSNGYDVGVCSLNGDGMADLLTILSTKIHEVSNTKNIAAEYYINKRQQGAINSLIISGNNILNQIKNNVSHDIIADLLHGFIDILNEIVNPINKEDIINEIFSTFCVGK